jgi:hypothetical protein
LDRSVILLAFTGFLVAKPVTINSIPRPLRRVGIAALAFIGAAGLTVGKSPDPLYAGRYLVDSFVVPLCFAWCVLAWFEVRRRLPTLHTAVCICTIISAAVAAAEMVTGQDLLPVPGSKLEFAGDIPRPNGPFATNDQLALIGAVSLFFLLFMRAALGQKITAGRRLLHSVGLAAAVGMALMPMFRSVLLTLLIILVIDAFWERGPARRVWRIALILTIAGLISAARIFLPSAFEDRSDSDNVYARIAEYEQSLSMFADHPLLGVGYSNFHNFVVGESQYIMSFHGVQSVDEPHSNLTSALAETGLLGFVPYALMHIFVILAMWRLRQSSAAGRLVWKYFVYILLAYWLTGLTESSGFEPELNVWYAFAIAVCYKYALTAPHSPVASEAEAFEEDSSVPTPVFSPVS